MRRASPSAAVAMALCLQSSVGCASTAPWAGGELLFAVDDPVGDIRLELPPSPHWTPASFDLTRLEISATEAHLVVTATFARPVEVIRWARIRFRDVGPMVAQTIDVYLDTIPGEGFVEALPDRGFHLPAAEGWDRVLVLTSVPQVRHPGAIFPQHLLIDGRKLVGVFDRNRVGDHILGAVAVVSATSPVGEGRIRLVTPHLGDCQVWEDMRCTFKGAPPAIIDATAQVQPAVPLPLAYFGGPRPAPPRTPVVFRRGHMVGAAPVSPTRVRPGQLATVHAEDGCPLATAIVVGVAGDTASLEWVGTGSAASPANSSEANALEDVLEAAAYVVFVESDAAASSDFGPPPNPNDPKPEGPMPPHEAAP